MIRRVTIEGSTYAPPPHRFEAGTPPIGAGDRAWVRRRRGSPRSTGTALGRPGDRAHGSILDGLASLPGVRVQGPAGTQARLAVVSFSVDGVHPHDVCQLLDGAASACAAAIIAPSR